ncbi:DUF2973 domain-containing protein [Romeria aff. gracilis LEGE 07310]|uniref:DUF2973 domain-containing protein n=1 Tax=Vasconcelosia minhoensis LEGE 07310 TaxID=915328 RepID=A0A8J7AJT4_9CYAN|nr:DUF2973 domain-containing protein [Romeria gracilis]MBE9075939.1 DUF2973 domain-containing protein [Romeria aff. gracilis LEGE 07310]
MLHLLYILAFTVLAVLAVSNLIRNLVNLGIEARRPSGTSGSRRSDSSRPVPHPELLDDAGRVIDEPLLVMRSVSIKDARDQLDAMYDASGTDEHED